MSKQKVLLIGWDAADWNVARPLMEQGKMPALKRLIDGGVSGNLATIRPVLSPMLWTSIATGKRAWKHGIHGFSEPCPASGGIRPISNLSRKSKAVWNIFNQQGLKSNVIGWWPSHPAEPINGVMISNHFQQAVKNLGEDWPMRPGTVHPKSLETPLKEMRVHPAELENAHILPFIPKAAQIDDDIGRQRMESCAKIIAEISGIHAAATACMQLEPWDFMAVYYDGIDHFGHGFMRYHPPRMPAVSEKDFELYQGVIEAGYRYHDMMLDTLLRLAGDDTYVMLISDHGFEPGNLRPESLPNEPAGPAAEHSPYGIFCLSGPGIKKGERIHGASLLDITPTLLHLKGFPVGRDMDGKVLVNCFEAEQAVEYTESWEAIPGEDGSHPQSAQLESVESRESIRQLIELGYIDEPDPDRGKAVDETIRELQYNLAQAYMDGGAYAEAAKILKSQWDRWPEESRFGTKLLSCWMALEDAARAREIFDLMIERKKAAAEQAVVELKERTAAIQESEAKRKAEAEAKGEAYTPEQLPKREQQRLKRLRGWASSNPHALAFLRGCVLALEGNYEAALQSMQQAISVQAANRSSVLCKMGQIYRILGKLDEAETHYRQALEIAPNSHEAHLGLAEVLSKQGNHFHAAGEALASLELIFHNPRAHLIYGRALLQIGKPKLAEKTLLTAVAQNPNFYKAYRELSRYYTKVIKNPDEAARYDALAKAAEERVTALRSASSSDADEVLEFTQVIEQTNRHAPDVAKPLIVVSGLPRSGTSLMMQMLEAGGIEIISDAHRTPDESNPKGYYEDERVRKLPGSKDRSWLEDCGGRAVKIIAQLLPFLPKETPVKIIFMQRPATEVIRSQRTMLERDGKAGALTDDASVVKAFSKHLDGVNHFLKQNTMLELIGIDYAQAVSDPQATAEKVVQFLGEDLSVDAMAGVVDASLHRIKSS